MAERDPDAAKDKDPGMTHGEILLLMSQLSGRIDALWQRVIYAHAAIVGVMVFFGTTSEPFVLGRCLVLFVYTMNTLITFAAFNDAYKGLRAAVQDIRKFDDDMEDSAIQAWVVSSTFESHANRRAAILGMVWVVIAYLLLSPVATGLTG